MQLMLACAGKWEPYITKVYQEALKLFPQAVVIDVGANIGFFTVLAAAMGHTVIAVEPNAESVRRLRKGVMLNGLQDKVSTV
jgi:tRNA G37 N-methylase Trm5